MVERKTRGLQEMAQVMLHMHATSIHSWTKSISTAYYTINRVFLRLGTNQTSYELWSRNKSNMKYFGTFGSECYILKEGENLGRFDPKSNLGIFLGYYTKSKAYIVYN